MIVKEFRISNKYLINPRLDFALDPEKNTKLLRVFVLGKENLE